MIAEVIIQILDCHGSQSNLFPVQSVPRPICSQANRFPVQSVPKPASTIGARVQREEGPELAEPADWGRDTPNRFKVRYGNEDFCKAPRWENWYT